MCEALMELMKDELEAREARGVAIGEVRGKILGEARGQYLKLKDQINKKLIKGNTPEEIADMLEEDVETILKLMKEL